MPTPCDDIIHLPHHVSQNHPQMPMLDRAAQFAPFAALTGYASAVGETARLTSERRELDPQEAEELNRRLTELAARLKDRPEVTAVGVQRQIGNCRHAEKCLQQRLPEVSSDFLSKRYRGMNLKSC